MVADYGTPGANKTITIFLGPTLPLLWFENVLFVCGPMLMLVKHLAIMMGASLRAHRQVSSEMEALEVLTEERTEIIVTPIDADRIALYLGKAKKLGLDYTHTDYIDYTELSHILYKKYPDTVTMFSYLQFFQWEVIVLWVLSLIVLSLLQSVKNITLYNVFGNMFEFFSLLFNKWMPSALNRVSYRQALLLGTWLFALTIIQIYFCNFILDEKIKAIPDRVIDSWHDLYERREVAIMCQDYDPMARFAQQDNLDEMASNFKARMTTYEFGDFMGGKFSEIVPELVSGRAAYVNDRLQLRNSMKWMYDSINSDNTFEEFVHSLHISSAGYYSLPYFFGILASIEQDKARNMNRMYVRKVVFISISQILVYRISRANEAGLYNKWKSETLRKYYMAHHGESKRFYRDNFRSEQIVLSKVYDEMCIVIIGSFLSFIVFAIELILKFAQNYY